VPIPGHAHHAPAELAALVARLGVPLTGTADNVADALRITAERVAGGAPSAVLILGSLYLAGVVLEANGELPD